MGDESRLLAQANLANLAFGFGSNKVARTLGEAGEGLALVLAAKKAKAKAEAIAKSNRKKTDAVAIPHAIVGAIVFGVLAGDPVGGAKIGNTVGKSLVSPFTKDPGDGRGKGGSSLDQFLDQEGDPVGSPLDPLALFGGPPGQLGTQQQVSPSTQLGASSFTGVSSQPSGAFSSLGNATPKITPLK